MIRTKKVPLFAVLASVLVMASGCGRQHNLTEAEIRQQMFAELRTLADELAEADRRAKVQALLDSLEVDLQTMKETTAQFVADNKELNADYDATRYDFDRLQARFNGDRQRLQQKILTAKFQIKELVTPDEWSKLVNAKNRLMQELLDMN